MNKGRIKPAQDRCKTIAVEKLAKKYSRSLVWAYWIAAKDKRVQDGEYFKDAYADYQNYYNEAKEFFNN